MPNKVFLTTLGADVIFLATGCLELGFCLVVRNLMFKDPKDGQEAVRNLIYQTFPLDAGIVNAAFIIFVALFTAAGLLSPVRIVLKTSGYAIALCGLFTLCIGVALWVETLTIKDTFFPTYVGLEPKVQELIQTDFNCCGYINATTPAFVTDATCPSPAAAALLRGCSVFISSFANTFIDNIFTAVFGMVGMDALLILAISCLLKDRKERDRYRHIDDKAGFRQF
ncbi:hypothetical protein CP532_3851 [Ophiocordyceps camponoti-leonardi (nom. inval.)]|nr:hypothetical protein CP532_3851 [Ophiocordyceps camponoti-leonardi (nom. inval.)]